LTTLPFLTAAVGMDSRMWAVMTSPMRAVRVRLPMHADHLGAAGTGVVGDGSLDSIWIMGRVSFGFEIGPIRESGSGAGPVSVMFEHFDETPALEFAQRAGFDDADAVADLGFACFRRGRRISWSA
jgi:hypothetical protein